MLSTLATACGAKTDPSAAATRRILVDYNLDDFPTSYFGYFPRFVEAHPGDTLKFEQAWSGDPHTVTFGTLVQEILPKFEPLLKARKDLEDFDVSSYGLPSIFPKDTNTIEVNQTAAQPCYVQDGPIPDNGVGCDQHEPAFDGTQKFFNSGYIPYKGLRGNRFEMKLSESIKPGEYMYYCLLHGPAMSGYVTVKPKGTAVHNAGFGLHDPDLKATTDALRRTHALAATKKFRLPGTDIAVGAFDFSVKHGIAWPGSVNEFLPSTFHAKVGQKVTWSFGDGPPHTVSFDVPPYIPAIDFGAHGKVSVNPDVAYPKGGPGYPNDPTYQAPDDGAVVDVGNYDGRHFLSSGGPDGPMRYSITFTRPGTYNYACLLHPRMLGKVVVS